MPSHLQVLDPLYLLIKSYETEALHGRLEMAKICLYMVSGADGEGRCWKYFS